MDLLYIFYLFIPFIAGKYHCVEFIIAFILKVQRSIYHWHLTYVSILKLWCLGNKCFWTADRRAAGDGSRPHQEASQACCSWSGTTVSHPGARNAHDEHCQSPVTVCQFGLHFWFHGLWTDRKKRKWVFFYCVQLFLINIKLFCLFFK